VAAAVLGGVFGYLVFGFVADASHAANHLHEASLVTFLPALVFVVFLLLVPETKGKELEDTTP
jgi:hypothetical protein